MVKDNPSERGGGGQGRCGGDKWSLAKTHRVFINTGGDCGGGSAVEPSARGQQSRRHTVGETESVMNENDNMSHLEMFQLVGMSDEGKSYIGILF